MKFSVFASLLSLFISHSVLASGISGKYQMQLSNGLSGVSGSYAFLMNSQGEIKLIDEDSGYYIHNLQTSLFFGDLDVEIEWGSDEDVHYFSFTLSEVNDVLVMTKSCSLYVDGPNDLHEFGEAGMELRKWNTVSKQYEDVVTVQSQSKLRECEKALAGRYSIAYE